ncbi:MAG: translation initiation factor IF-2 [Pseudomonadota bacterium]|nr:translation initiation factor IF-2 [Pseudomonadota bacterium]
MADVTVEKLATILKIDVERLLAQLKDAGVEKGAAEDVVSDEEKQKLLAFLRQSHGQDEAPKKITLSRKSTSTIKTAGASGKSKTVNVEVRKKRTYIKRSVIENQNKKVEEERLQKEAEERAKLEAEEAARKAAEEERKQAAEEEERKKEAAAVAKEKEIAEKKAKKQQPKAEQTEKEKQTAKESSKRKLVDTSAIDEKAARLAEEERKKVQAEKERHDAERKGQKDLEAKAAKQTAKLVEKYKDEAEKADQNKPVETKIEHGSKLVEQAFESSLEKEAREIRRRKDAKKRAGGRRNEQAERDPKRPLNKSSILGNHGFQAPTEKQIKIIEIGSMISVTDLAQKMSIKVNQLVKEMFKMGEMVTANQSIDYDTAALVVEEFGHEPKHLSETAIEDALADDIQRKDDGLKARAPVVTIMGHVDHGKTSLLDYIRKAHVADGEAGGITQHIGAYNVDSKAGNITFLDTPGHAAFTAMRARGAKATDIVIIVVAADDGVMPQTEEAIQHAKAANLPIIIAVNKIDKEGADLERIKSDMAAKEVVPEDWGGDYPFIPVSAHTGQGIDDLLENISLQAELLELAAHEEGVAEGVVIESKLEKGRGSVTTLLVQEGALKVGDTVLAGTTYGRVRAMIDDQGRQVKKAGPSIPVEILGLNDVPNAGDKFMVVENDRKAKEVASFREANEREERLSRQQASKLENMFANMGKDQAQVVNIILKADVRGSLEAISAALNDLSTDEVKVAIVTGGVGGISESDVHLAITSDAFILGFNVRADNASKKLAEAEGIDMRYYSVIYELIDDVKAAMSGLLAPERREEIVGIAQVKDVFRSSKFGAVAGSIVTEGVVYKNEPIRVLRDNVVVYEGELESLRRFKDDVAEVKSGTECGIAVKGYNDVQPGDQIEVFKVTEVKREI